MFGYLAISIKQNLKVILKNYYILYKRVHVRSDRVNMVCIGSQPAFYLEDVLDNPLNYAKNVEIN